VKGHQTVGAFWSFGFIFIFENHCSLFCYLLNYQYNKQQGMIILFGSCIDFGELVNYLEFGNLSSKICRLINALLQLNEV